MGKTDCRFLEEANMNRLPVECWKSHMLAETTTTTEIQCQPETGIFVFPRYHGLKIAESRDKQRRPRSRTGWSVEATWDKWQFVIALGSSRAMSDQGIVQATIIRLEIRPARYLPRYPSGAA